MEIKSKDEVKEIIENILYSVGLNQEKSTDIAIEIIKEIEVECSDLQNAIQKLINMSGGYISTDNELILDQEENVFFLLEDVKNILELKCKVLEWLSRPAHKLPRERSRVKIKYIINQFLGTNFDEDDLSYIYEHLGNCCDRKLTIKFIESDYKKL